MKEICERFNKYNFHDSKILSFKLSRELFNKEEIDNFYVDIKILNNIKQYETSTLKFTNCKYLIMDLDVLNKRHCSDDILTTSASMIIDIDKLWQEYQKRGPINLNREDFNNDYINVINFKILFCHPAGQIEIYANNFELINGQYNK